MGFESLIRDNDISWKTVWELVHKQAFTKSVKYSDKSNNPINGVFLGFCLENHPPRR